MNKRIVNCRFVCCGLHFDAAIDCDYDMHCYGECFDHPEWDIRMMYHKERNDQQNAKYGLTYRTCADIDAIKREARRWVREMRGKK